MASAKKTKDKTAYATDITRDDFDVYHFISMLEEHHSFAETWLKFLNRKRMESAQAKSVHAPVWAFYAEMEQLRQLNADLNHVEYKLKTGPKNKYKMPSKLAAKLKERIASQKQLKADILALESKIKAHADKNDYGLTLSVPFAKMNPDITSISDPDFYADMLVAPGADGKPRYFSLLKRLFTESGEFEAWWDGRSGIGRGFKSNDAKVKDTFTRLKKQALMDQLKRKEEEKEHPIDAIAWTGPVPLFTINTILNTPPLRDALVTFLKAPSSETQLYMHDVGAPLGDWYKLIEEFEEKREDAVNEQLQKMYTKYVKPYIDTNIMQINVGTQEMEPILGYVNTLMASGGEGRVVNPATAQWDTGTGIEAWKVVFTNLRRVVAGDTNMLKKFHKSPQYMHGLAELDRTKGAVKKLANKQKPKYAGGEKSVKDDDRNAALREYVNEYESRDDAVSMADALFADDELYYFDQDFVDDAVDDYAFSALRGGDMNYARGDMAPDAVRVGDYPYIYADRVPMRVRGPVGVDSTLFVGVVLLMCTIMCGLMCAGYACFGECFGGLLLSNAARKECKSEEEDVVDDVDDV